MFPQSVDATPVPAFQTKSVRFQRGPKSWFHSRCEGTFVLYVFIKVARWFWSRYLSIISIFTFLKRLLNIDHSASSSIYGDSVSCTTKYMIHVIALDALCLEVTFVMLYTRTYVYCVPVSMYMIECSHYPMCVPNFASYIGGVFWLLRWACAGPNRPSHTLLITQ
jgi:hypothetical protein